VAQYNISAGTFCGNVSEGYHLVDQRCFFSAANAYATCSNVSMHEKKLSVKYGSYTIVAASRKTSPRCSLL
jgi:hypothetical protein